MTKGNPGARIHVDYQVTAWHAVPQWGVRRESTPAVFPSIRACSTEAGVILQGSTMKTPTWQHLTHLAAAVMFSWNLSAAEGGFNGLAVNLGNIYRLSEAKTRSISPENF